MATGPRKCDSAPHLYQRLVATASAAAKAWNLLPDETDAAKQP